MGNVTSKSKGQKKRQDSPLWQVSKNAQNAGTSLKPEQTESGAIVHGNQSASILNIEIKRSNLIGCHAQLL